MQIYNKKLTRKLFLPFFLPLLTFNICFLNKICNNISVNSLLISYMNTDFLV